MKPLRHYIEQAARRARYVWALLPASVLLVFGIVLEQPFSYPMTLTKISFFFAAVIIAAALGLLLWWQVEAATSDQPLSRDETLKLASVFGIVVAAMTAAAGFIDAANNEIRKPVDELTVANCKAAAYDLSSLARTSPAVWSETDLSRFDNLLDKLLLTEDERVADGMAILRYSVERRKELFLPEAKAEHATKAFLLCSRAVVEACRLQLSDMRLSLQDVLPKGVVGVEVSGDKLPNACPTLRGLLQ